jgi:hypothetical protein
VGRRELGRRVGFGGGGFDRDMGIEHAPRGFHPGGHIGRDAVWGASAAALGQAVDAR